MLPKMRCFGGVIWYAFLCASDVAASSHTVGALNLMALKGLFDHALCLTPLNSSVGCVILGLFEAIF